MFNKHIKAGRRRSLFTPGSTTQTVELGRPAIERMLPHRDPFLMVDRIVRVDLEQEAVEGERVVAADDPTELVPMEEVERRYILRVVETVAGNKTMASKILGLDRKTLYRKLERYKRE